MQLTELISKYYVTPLDKINMDVPCVENVIILKQVSDLIYKTSNESDIEKERCFNTEKEALIFAKKELNRTISTLLKQNQFVIKQLKNYNLSINNN